MLVAIIHVSGSAADTPADGDLLVARVAPGDTSLPAGVDAVALVGEPGATTARLPIMAAVAAFAAAGGPVLGIGGGFQALCEVGLLPGTLVPAPPPGSARRDVILRVEGQPTPFTQGIAAGRLLRLPQAYAGVSYRHDDPAALERAGQVVFRYVDGEGGVTDAADPTGSVGNVAGVCDGEGRAVGLAVHPGDVSAALLGVIDGGRLLDSLALYLQDRDAAT